MDVQGIRFLRKEVQDDLAQALQVLSSSHGIEKKKVVLHFAGTGKRRVRIGYILEAPVWKTSYRLVLGDTGQHLLQGWALVENTSDTDWTSVALTLVSGRPITFTMDLYQPLYIQRPEVQLELYQSLRAEDQPDGDGRAGRAADEAAWRRRRRAAGAPAPSAKPRRAPRPRSPAALARGRRRQPEFSVSQGVTAAARGGQVGELFQYVIDKPVTLPRQQSAMLPILNQQVSGERYSLYNESTDPKYPLNAVKLKNASSLHLMQGPITVFDGGTYAGDAQITDLAPGARAARHLRHGPGHRGAAAPGRRPGHAGVGEDQQGGLLLHEQGSSRERDYTIKNRGTKNRTVLIEHPFQPEWTLASPEGGRRSARGTPTASPCPWPRARAARSPWWRRRSIDAERRALQPRRRPGGVLRQKPGGEPGGEGRRCRSSSPSSRRCPTPRRSGAARRARVNEIANDQSRIRAEHGPALPELRPVQALREDPHRRGGRAGEAARRHREAARPGGVAAEGRGARSSSPSRCPERRWEAGFFGRRE